jgi:hypothetical protein
MKLLYDPGLVPLVLCLATLSVTGVRVSMGAEWNTDGMITNRGNRSSRREFCLHYEVPNTNPTCTALESNPNPLSEGMIRDA